MLRELLAKFAVSFDTKELHKGQDKIAETIEGLKHLGHAVAGAFAYHMVEKFVENLSEEAATLRRASKQLGVNVHDLEQMQFAAGQAGVASEELGMGLRFLQRNAFEAGQKSSQAAKYFQALGIEVKGADGHVKPTTGLLLEVAEAFKDIEDPAERTAAAMKLFGRGGAAMIPLLSQGEEKIREYMGEVEELGGGFSDEFHKMSGELRKHEKALDMLKRSIKQQLAGQGIPALMALGHAFEDFGKYVLRANKNGELMRLTMAGFTFMALAKLPAVVATLKHLNWQLYLGWARLLIMYVVLDDIITWLRGGESVVGKFFEQFIPGSQSAAKALGEFFDFATSRQDNFNKSLAIIPSAIGMAIAVAANEIAISIVGMMAWVDDQWDILLRKMHAPDWIKDILGSRSVYDESGVGNQWHADQEANQSREAIGKRFIKTLEGPAWQEYQTAVQQRQVEQGWQGSNGQMGKFAWDMTQNAPTQVASQPVPSALARPNVVNNDHSKTEVHVTVPGTTTGTIAQKTATETARAVRNENRAALFAMEPAVE